MRLEADLSRLRGGLPGAKAAHEPPPADLPGPVSQRALRRAHALVSAAHVLVNQNMKYVELYGTRSVPREHGPASSGARRAWRRLDDVDRQLRQLNAKIAELNVRVDTVRAPWWE
jgi:hypothetical protein